MSEETTTQDTEAQIPDRLTALKQRADLMNISYHPNIGADKLSEKINAVLDDKSDPEEAQNSEPEVAVAAPVVEETAAQKRYRKKKEALQLVRVRITCMNPNKRLWKGEFFTVGNRLIGMETKYVAFGVEYHLPRIHLNVVQERMFQGFEVVEVNGKEMNRGRLVKEFAVEILPDLTPTELHDLAQRQAMAGSIDA